jgi:hypothetical protein
MSGSSFTFGAAPAPPPAPPAGSKASSEDDDPEFIDDDVEIMGEDLQEFMTLAKVIIQLFLL